MTRKELSIGNFVYCPHLDPKHPYRVYMVDKIRPVWDGDGVAPGYAEEDARVMLTRAGEHPFYRRLLGERPGKFIYASQLKPIPIRRFFEECKDRLSFERSSYIIYSFCVESESCGWVPVTFSHLSPLKPGTRWFVNIEDPNLGFMRFPIFHFHQYQTILKLYGLSDRYFSGHYFVENEEYESRIS